MSSRRAQKDAKKAENNARELKKQELLKKELESKVEIKEEKQ